MTETTRDLNNRGSEAGPDQGAELLEHQKARTERRISPSYPDGSMTEEADKLIRPAEGIESQKARAIEEVVDTTGSGPVQDHGSQKPPLDWINESIGKPLPANKLSSAVEEVGAEIERRNKAA